MLGFPKKESCPSLAHLMHYKEALAWERSEAGPAFPPSSRLREYLLSKCEPAEKSGSSRSVENAPADLDSLRKRFEENKDQLVSLVECTLAMEPPRRPSAQSALDHPYFTESCHSPPRDNFLFAMGEK